MTVNVVALNAAATAIGTAVTHLGLVNASGTELSGGTYARLPVTWTVASAGVINPTSDKVFNVPAGQTVGGWRGYTALTSGTDYGGASLTNEVYAAAGTYTLVAAGTGYDADAS
jgi:hypothetical protein